MMTNFRRYVSAAIIAATMTLSATAPANAYYDPEGRFVMMIIDEDGNVYY